jgi:hypothetical protein
MALNGVRTMTAETAEAGCRTRVEIDPDQPARLGRSDVIGSTAAIPARNSAL